MSGSEYFHAMFLTDMSEHNKDCVMIGGISKEVFSCILDFLYSGTGTCALDSNCKTKSQMEVHVCLLVLVVF